jgi:hypothetical protein
MTSDKEQDRMTVSIIRSNHRDGDHTGVGNDGTTVPPASGGGRPIWRPTRRRFRMPGEVPVVRRRPRAHAVRRRALR